MGAVSRFPKQRSASRSALAEAQNEAGGLARVHVLAQASLGRAQDQRDQCVERLAQAKAAALEAHQAYTDAMIRAAENGEAINSAGAARTARYAELDATDDLDAADRALAHVKEKADEAAWTVEEARKRMAKLASAVIAEEAIEAVLEEERRAEIAHERQKLAMGALSPFVPNGHERSRWFGSIVYHQYANVDAERAAIRKLWSDAYDALLMNPDAPLPPAKVNFDDKDDVEAA